MGKIYFFHVVVRILSLIGFVSWLPAQSDLPKLVDITHQAGITFIHNFGDDEMSNLIESNAAGCAFFDYDGDGDLDIYFVKGAYIESISHIGYNDIY